MSFQRTTSGLSNLASFYSVDKIVYVEGGDTSYSYNDVIQNNKYSEKSDDILFWDTLFDYFRNDIKVQFRAIGSKKNLIEIAKTIKSNNLKTVIVAMDRDFDSKINHSNILYTYGYGWENDVCVKENLYEYIKKTTTLSRSSTVFNNICNLLNIKYELFIDSVKKTVILDKLFFNKPIKIFDKGGKNCLKYFDTSNAIVNKQSLELFTKKQIKETSKKFSFNKHSISNIDIARDCYCHFIYDFIYSLMMFLNKSFDGIRIESKSENIKTLLVSIFTNNFTSLVTLRQHYSNAFTALL